jgi:hypothetical protein
MINNIERRKPSSIIYNNKLLDRLIGQYGATLDTNRSFSVETDETFIPRWQFFNTQGETTTSFIGKSLNAQAGTAIGTANVSGVGTHV